MHVPVWHEASRDLRDSGAIAMVGILEEQHPDRARLFRQWKGLDWPLLVDSYDRLEVPFVPITLAIDEHGIVREVMLPMSDPGAVLDAFAAEEFAEPKTAATPAREYAGAVTGSIDEVVAAYGKQAAGNPGDGYAWFRLGVAQRARYDSDARRPDDFLRAVESWTRALKIDPNNYIWRRRLQQYGPRLDKPYPFYDWVRQARAEISGRGETPVTLGVEPGPAEIAAPERRFSTAAPDSMPADPEGRIHRDPGELIHVRTVVVPPQVAPGEAARVHVELVPNRERKAHWNNEVEDLVLRVEPPGAWAVNPEASRLPRPAGPLSTETRRVEFEVRCPEDAEPGTVTVPVYALYYVCEDVTGVCLYRRQDVEVPVQVVPSTP